MSLFIAIDFYGNILIIYNSPSHRVNHKEMVLWAIV